jgi:hypothetical protein
MTKIAASAAILATLIATSSFAQQPQQSRLRGTIESVDGETVRIKSRDGADISAHMAGNVPVSGVVKITIADIKAGDYVGATTTPGPNDSNLAVEVHTIANRGAGEGSRPWDLKPNSSMTNGSVDQTIVSNDGHTLVLKYRGGEKKVTVTPDTVVVTSVPAERTELKAGAKVFAAATKNADGSYELVRISVGRDGLTPPM